MTLIAPQAASAAGCLKYMPAKATVVGRVYERTDWGPPNYGEDTTHDSRERHLYVRLKKPLCVAADRHSNSNDPAEEKVQIMELTWDPKKVPVPATVGRWVLLNGGLFHGDNGHHHTRVLLMVSSVKPIGRTPPGKSN
jgi:hypothetical protein